MDLIYSSQVFGDVDLDGDLDLITTGTGELWYQSFVYINNITSPKNTAPDPPAVASLSASYSSGQLTLSWANASDNQTPTAGLYYNLRVGTSLGGHQIVTGVYGGGDDNGYFGNMMQRRNITLNRQLDPGTTVYWAVQTIDTGLKAGNWTAEQEYVVPGGVPAWSGNVTSIPAMYSPTTPSIFNISWTNNVSHVFLESNFSGVPANYSMANITASVFNFSRVLAAGSHYWKSFANSTVGLWNSTVTWLFSIARAAPAIALDIGGVQGPTSMNEDTSVWLNTSVTTGDSNYRIDLWIDGSHKGGNTSGMHANYTLFNTPGTFNISLNYTATQNYSFRMVSYILTVTDITYPAYTAPLNVTPATFNKAHTLNFTLNWTDNFNLSSAWIEVNRSGTLVLYTATNQTAGRTSASTRWNLTLTDFPAGTHYWRSNASDGAGNTNTTGWYAFAISKIAPTLNLTLNGTNANITVEGGSSIWLNGSVVTGDGGATLTLFLDSVQQNSGTSVSNLTQFSLLGNFNISLNYTTSQNYTAAMTSYIVTVVDTTVPGVTNLVPIAGTRYFNNTNVTLSADITDNVNISAVWANVSWANGSLLLNLALGTSPTYSAVFSNTSGTGVYNVTFFANDTTNNRNSTQTTWFNVTTVPDTIPPGWSAPTESPADPATYSQTANYTFNVTWTDAYAIALVRMEHNFTGTLANYSVTTHAESIYSYTYGPIAVGTYVWRMYANDSSGNANATPQYTYNVTRATPTINLTLNGTAGAVAIDEGSSIWLNGSVVTGDSGATLALFLNSVQQSSGTSVSNLTAFATFGTYNVSLNYTATQNYTAAMVSHLVTVNDFTAPAYSAPLNVTPSSFNKNHQLNFSINWTDNLNTSHVVVEVNRSGTVANHTPSNSTGPSTWNLTLTGFPAGTHGWRSHANDTTGNRNTTPWYFFTISKIAPTLNLSLNGSEAALTMNEDTTVVLNGSLATGDIGATLTMAIDGASYLSGTSLRNETVFATPGTYNISLSYTATQNYSSSGNKSYLLTVIDRTAPVAGANITVVPATFNKAHSLNFTANWTDNFNLTSAWIEVNRSGALILYTATNQTAGRTSASTLWNLTLSDFPAGTHYWRSNASDGAGNVNTTAWYSFTIAKASPTLNLTLNGTAGNVTIGQASSIWLNGSATTGDGSAILTLFLDSVQQYNGTSVSNLTNFSTIGTFNISLNYTSTQNYTAGMRSYFVTVVDVTAPVVSSHSPTDTVTSSSTTLTATTNENSTCRYSTAAGTAYASMASMMSGNTTAHTAGLTGLSTGTYSYYLRCNNTAGLVATTDYNATITVSISTGGGSSGGSTVATDTTPTTTKVISSVSKESGIEISISKATIPVETITIAVTESATDVEITVTATDEKPETVAAAPTGSGGAERTVYKYLDISQTNLAGKIASATIDFKVTKAWLDNNSADKTQVVLQRHTGTSWEELATAITKETAANVYYSATTTGFSVFAIAVKEKAAAEPEAEPGEEPGEEPGPGEQQEEQPGEEPEEQPPAEPARKSIFQSALFTIAAATILATTGIGFIYRNRLTIGARIDDLLELLRRRREQRGKRR